MYNKIRTTHVFFLLKIFCVDQKDSTSFSKGPDIADKKSFGPEKVLTVIWWPKSDWRQKIKKFNISTIR